MVDEPCPRGPYDVVVKIAAAGLCRTDIHIIEGMLEPFGVRLPIPRGMRPGAGSNRPGRRSTQYAPVTRCW
jgi:NADPH:quinone reductase-like Zn-dependent oxidoreductase